MLNATAEFCRQVGEEEEEERGELGRYQLVQHVACGCTSGYKELISVRVGNSKHQQLQPDPICVSVTLSVYMYVD